MPVSGQPRCRAVLGGRLASWAPAWLLVSGLAWGAPADPSTPLRVLSWNAQGLTRSADAESTLESRLNSAALWLRQFEPDVILVQDLPDRQAARRLAGRMGEPFAVATCSTLPASSKSYAGAGEIAVLSRLSSPIAWAGAWEETEGAPLAGGYAFAVLQQGERWIAVHSVRLPPGPEAAPQRDAATRQLLQQVARAEQWSTHRPEAHLLGGTFEVPAPSPDSAGHPLALATAVGFQSAMQGLPAEARQSSRTQPAGATLWDDLWSRASHFPAPPQLAWGIASDHACLVVDWRTDTAEPQASPPGAEVEVAVEESPVSPAAADLPVLATEPPEPTPAAQPPSPRHETPSRAVEAPAEPPASPGSRSKWWVAGFVAVIALAGLVFLFRPARQSGGLAPWTPASHLGPNHERKVPERMMVPALRPHLLAWLKEQFIGRLLSQRRDMIRSQAEAAERAEELGRRMATIHKGLLQRIRQAELRVQELERELAQARAENRELVKINLAMAQRELREARQKAGLPQPDPSTVSSV